MQSKITLRQAAQRALKAMEDGEDRADMIEFSEALIALRAALAEPEQEPVTWMVYTEGGTAAYVTDNPNDLVGAYRALPLYTAPPQRKPLTDEEIERACVPLGAAMLSFTEVARAIEAAHGIKENT
jgi:hypothetical protein